MRTQIRRAVLARLTEWYGLDPETFDSSRPFAEYGLTSRDAVALVAELGRLTDRRLPPTLLWDTPTLDALLDRLDELEHPPDTAELSAAPTARRAPSAQPGEPVAVVGLGCRLPGGVDSPSALWELLADGLDAVTSVPPGRWEEFVPDGVALPADLPRTGGFLDDVAGFDAEFFGISPYEATAMDPQQRLLLEVAREALDHAGIPAPSLAGTAAGVFVGISGNEYARLTTADLDAVDGWTAPGAALSIAANRLSYALDLRGPSLALDTACSSSLVALDEAFSALGSGACDTALAGGVNLLLSPAVTLGFQRAGALAESGRCRAFDAAADGIVRGEGCGVAVLKRLADAERDGDRILAVVEATAVNSDGRSNGLLAPSAEAQRAVLAAAHAQPGTVDYVEAHGTGTPLGDPVEASALGDVLGRGRDPEQALLVGSAKTTFGHLEAAAGITGFLKTVLALHHDEIPAQLHFTRPNPHLDAESWRLRFVAEPEPWPRYSGRARAGVSAFGFGGTNAHVVVAEYGGAERAPRPPRQQPAAQPTLLLLDGLDDGRVRADAGALGAWLAAQPRGAAPLPDVARTVNGRLGRGSRRVAVVAHDAAEAAAALDACAAQRPHPQAVVGDAVARRAVWVFSGYGSQWPGMASGLLDTEPAFAAAVDRVEPVLHAQTGVSLRAGLAPDAALETPAQVQPVLFGLQVCLAELWRSYGARPAAVLGHSMGELAAAVVTGVLDLADGARIIGARSRLLDGLDGGAMALVDRSAAEVERYAEKFPSLHVAVHAAPEQTVVTGSDEDVAELLALVQREGGFVRSLGVSAAGHSPRVDPLLEPLATELGTLAWHEPECPFYSTVTEDPRDAWEFGTAYWTANLRQPVRFAPAVQAAAADGHRLFLEVSPHPTQLRPLTETLEAEGRAATVLGTLRRPAQDRRAEQPDGPTEAGDTGVADGDTHSPLSFRTHLAELLVHTVDPSAHTALRHDGRVVDVPLPEWRHRRHWAGEEPELPSQAVESAEPDGDEATPRSAVDRLRRLAAAVLGRTPDSLPGDIPLPELGLDSLVAARLRTAVEREFDRRVPPATLLRHATLDALAELLTRPEGEEELTGEAEQLRGTAPESAPADGAHTSTPADGAPRDAVERLVAHTWHHLVGGELPGVRTRLPLLEGSRAHADRYAAALAEAVGEAVTVDELAAAGTVDAIAALLRPRAEGADAPPLRTLRSGTGTPLFLAHPAGGSTTVYRTLVDRLAAHADRPVYGLEPVAEQTEVAERAARHAALIREVTPNGPWLLGGWSYGGVLAQETARLLAAHGEVRAVLLLDSVLPLPAPEGLTPKQEAHRRFDDFAAYVHTTYGAELPLDHAVLAELDDTAQVDWVMRALAQAVQLPDAVLAHQRASYLDLRSGERHTPGGYAGRTVLYRATDTAPHTVRDERYERTDAALGWDAHCTALTVRPISGHHLLLLDPPVVDELAELVALDLKEADGG